MGLLAASGPTPQQLQGIAGVSIVAVGKDSPAAEAGLQEMDVIVAADGVTLADGEPDRAPGEGETIATLTLQQVTDAARERQMTMTVLRGMERLPIDSIPQGVRTTESELPGVSGLEVVSAPDGSSLSPGDLFLGPERQAVAKPEVVEVVVTPYYDEDAQRGLVGVTITQPLIMSQLGIPAAMWHGARTTALMTESMIDALVRMVRREMEADLRGPLGIAELSKETMDRGAQSFLQFMAVLSINLAIINLLPIPALDGGRLLFIAAEAVRGRRIEPSREAVVHLIGFALVIGLMAMLTVFDGWRLLTGP
jgi:regulator of sigma E protease